MRDLDIEEVSALRDLLEFAIQAHVARAEEEEDGASYEEALSAAENEFGLAMQVIDELEENIA